VKRALYLILCIASLGIVIGARHKNETLVLSRETLAFSLDIHGNVYVIDSKLNFIKRSAEGDTLRMISVLNQGSQPILDVSNPLEVFIYFASTGRIAWYDNQLNPGGTLDIFATGINNIGGFGRANDGNIWLFDNNKGILKRVNREGEIIEESLMLQGQGTESSQWQGNIGAHQSRPACVEQQPRIAPNPAWEQNDLRLESGADFKL
jgi:hypothetical protein